MIRFCRNLILCIHATGFIDIIFMVQIPHNRSLYHFNAFQNEMPSKQLSEYLTKKVLGKMHSAAAYEFFL